MNTGRTAAFSCIQNQTEHLLIVFIVPKDTLSIVAARNYVIQTTLYLEPRLSSHDVRISHPAIEEVAINRKYRWARSQVFEPLISRIQISHSQCKPGPRPRPSDLSDLAFIPSSKLRQRKNRRIAELQAWYRFNAHPQENCRIASLALIQTKHCK